MEDVPIISTYLHQEISNDLSGFTTLTVEIVNATTTVGVYEIVGFECKLFCYNTSRPTPAPVVSIIPTNNPSIMPTKVPTVVPSNSNPTIAPTDDLTAPTPSPTLAPANPPTPPLVLQTMIHHLHQLLKHKFQHHVQLNPRPAIFQN